MVWYDGGSDEYDEDDRSSDYVEDDRNGEWNDQLDRWGYEEVE